MLTHNFLNQYLPFQGLSEQLLSKVAQNVKVARAAKGNIIFKRGRILSDLYFLIEGEVDLINNEFGIEKVRKGGERQAQPLNQFSPTVVSAIAKSPVRYFTVDSSWLENAIAVANAPPERVSSTSGEDFIGEMQVGDLADSDDWMSCILQSPVFSRIPSSQLQELFARFEKVPVESGERIVKEGAKGDYFYVIASGTCRVTNRSGSVDVALSAGDYFGEEALISNAPRNASVMMTSDGVLKRLNADDFLELIKTPVLRFLSQNEVGQLNKPFKILDVRMPIEYRAQHFPGSVNMPLSRLRDTLAELSQGITYLVSGEGGTRAEIAAYILCQAGFDANILTIDTVQTQETLSQVS